MRVKDAVQRDLQGKSWLIYMDIFVSEKSKKNTFRILHYFFNNLERKGWTYENKSQFLGPVVALELNPRKIEAIPIPKISNGTWILQKVY